MNEDSIVMRGLDAGFKYHIRVVAVDGDYQSPGQMQEVYIYEKFPQDPSQRGGKIKRGSRVPTPSGEPMQ